MIDKTPKDKNRCRNVLVTVKHTVEDEAAGDHRFEIIQITSNEKKQKVVIHCSILVYFCEDYRYYGARNSFHV